MGIGGGQIETFHGGVGRFRPGSAR
jgi:hypothetical protein